MTAAVLQHVTVTASDFTRSVVFYDAVLGALGLARLVELVDEEEDELQLEAVGWGLPDSEAEFWLLAGAAPTSGLHVRLRATGRAQVETFHAVGVEIGAASRAAPRRWPIYRRGEFSAMLADPDGNLLEAVAAE